MKDEHALQGDQLAEDGFSRAAATGKSYGQHWVGGSTAADLDFSDAFEAETYFDRAWDGSDRSRPRVVECRTVADLTHCRYGVGNGQ